MKNKVHVKKGDEVIVISGKDRGKSGKVVEVIRRDGLVIVEGINMLTYHVIPRIMGEPGGIVDAEAPMYASKVMLKCPKCGKATRLAHKVFADGSKQRLCKHCQETF